MHNTLGNTFPVIYPLHLKMRSDRKTPSSIAIAASNLFFYFDEETFRPETAGYIHFLELLDKWLSNTMGSKIHPVMFASDENPFELHFNPYLLFENRGADQGLTTVMNNQAFENLQEWLDELEDDEYNSITTVLVAKDVQEGERRLLHLTTVDYYHYPRDPECDDLDLYTDGYLFDFNGVMALRRAVLCCLYPSVVVEDSLKMRVTVNDCLDRRPVGITNLYKTTRGNNRVEFALFCNPFKPSRDAQILSDYSRSRCLLGSSDSTSGRVEAFGRVMDNIPSEDYYSSDDTPPDYVFESDLSFHTYMTAGDVDLYNVEGFSEPIEFEQMFQFYTEGFSTLKQPWEV